MSELDEILSGTDDVTEPTEDVQEEEVTEEPTGEEPTDEAETEEEPEEKPKSEAKKDSTPEPKEDEESDWRYQAYKDEKRKRQELENRLKELEQPKEQEKAPDVFDDQDGYTSYLTKQVHQQVSNVKADLSQYYAEREFGKEVVAEKLERFKQMAADDPRLSQQVLNSVSPYHEMVDIVTKAEKYEQLQDVDSMEAKLRSEIEEKVRKELKEKYEEKQQKRESVTPSLNKQASSNKAESSDSLEDLLGR